MRKLRVVLVDDEIMIREGFKKLFDWGAHDCEVVGEAADGVEALGVIDSLVPDIVIMDINIPIMNGLKVIQTSRLKYPDMAFIVVSGYDDFSYCREALRLQITDYILKPVDYEEFGNTIDHLKISIFEKQTKDVTPGSVNDCWNCTVYAGASGRRNQLECSRGNISSERTVYQPALQE